jgi:hypothetical protein
VAAAEAPVDGQRQALIDPAAQVEARETSLRNCSSDLSCLAEI